MIPGGKEPLELHAGEKRWEKKTFHTEGKARLWNLESDLHLFYANRSKQ